ncbi:MAG: hypothetical protein LW878_07170 [Proteobacteria bacterium]|jgi:hypothetical protein|nr:hypothetical protein [Pseudomonadota bacterium]
MSQVPSTKPDAAQMQAQELNELLKMATLGHLPLFHQDWIRESFRENKRLSFARASRIVDEGLKKLSRHVTYDRKQTALNAFTAEERVTFIQSFFKMVEYKTLDQIKELH